MAKHLLRRHRSNRALAPILIVIVISLCLTLILGVLALYRQLSAEPEVPVQPEPIQTQPTVPPGVVSADGQSDSLLCLERYTVSLEQAAPEEIVATFAEESLDGAALQIQYLNAIRTYQLGGHPENPDYTQPLELQPCPLGDGTLSWQHYFLSRAITAWQTEVLLLQAAQEPRPITEEAFKPNETDDLHGKYVASDLPVNGFLYQDQPCYTPNSMHQEYLNGLEEQLDTLAREQGYASLADCTESAFGVGVEAQDLVDAAIRYNTAYMLLTEESYDVTATEDEVAAYLRSHADELPGEDQRTVTLRHLLLIPQGAKIAADGTVVADEKSWDSCKEQAESILQSWSWDYLNTLGKEANFARLANKESQDGGSKVTGGLYQNIRPGQLIEPLDDWCFDPKRKSEDVTVLRSQVGYHIVFFCGSQSAAETAARQAVIEEKQLERWAPQSQKQELLVDYSAVKLWVDPSQVFLAPVDVLYPDLAHQRFPEVMTYFQQDYMYSPYGGSYVGRGGCGITTFAMLCTYMNDAIQTPAMLAAKYPSYHDASGTRGELFLYCPAEMGFFLEKNTSNLEEAIEALKKGQIVISLQHGGHFTAGGHYLLVQNYYPESDTFQIRDSNIYNYGKLSGHKVDYFTRENLLSGGAMFYIMEKKITNIPACSRCGDGSAPEKLLNEDYLCSKCTAALSRRNVFLELMG